MMAEKKRRKKRLLARLSEASCTIPDVTVIQYTRIVLHEYIASHGTGV